MTNIFCIQDRLIGLLFFGLALGSCQRASYSFQPSESAKMVAVVPAADTSRALISPVPVSPDAPPRRPASPAPVRRSLPAGPTKRACEMAKQWRRPVRRPAAAAPHLAPPSHQTQTLVRDAAPAATPKKGVAVALAVLFGYLGLHLFYLGYRRRAVKYLVATILCAGLTALVLAMLPVASLNAALVVLFLASLGIIGIAVVYAYALLDALIILFSGTDALE